MSFKYLIDSENKIVYLRLVGSLTKDLEVQVFKDLVSAPEWKKNFNILQDIRQVDKVTLTYGDVVSIVDEQANLQEKGSFNAKLAIVAPVDFLYFTGRIWQQLGKSRKIDIGLYRKKKEAINWLNGDLT